LDCYYFIFCKTTLVAGLRLILLFKKSYIFSNIFDSLHLFALYIFIQNCNSENPSYILVAIIEIHKRLTSCDGKVAWIGEARSACRSLVGKQENFCLRCLRREQEDYIKVAVRR
jgi:hypothetical protein